MIWMKYLLPAVFARWVHVAVSASIGFANVTTNGPAVPAGTPLAVRRIGWLVICVNGSPTTPAWMLSIVRSVNLFRRSGWIARPVMRNRPLDVASGQVIDAGDIVVGGAKFWARRTVVTAAFRTWTCIAVTFSVGPTVS